MIRETFRCRTGILWNIKALREIGLDASRLYPKVITPPIVNNGEPSTSLESSDLKIVDQKEVNGVPVNDELHPEYADAVSCAHDRLALNPLWWILEVLPIRGRKQLPHTNTWEEYTYVNFGEGRMVPYVLDRTYVHRSVQMRMSHDLRYKWRAVGELEPVCWVD